LRPEVTKDVVVFVDELNHHIFDKLSSYDVKGSIITFISFLHVDVSNTNSHISGFVNYLRNLLPFQDVTAMELAGRVVVATTGNIVSSNEEFVSRVNVLLER
jgi:FKBP12-rapamycin complex-associated protein